MHPVTGERALFVSPGFTRGAREIRGYSPTQSEAILKLLWDEATRTEYTVRFRWAPGSIAFWDNRATAHLAIADAGHLDYDRVLYRVTLEGDVPTGVDGRVSESVSGEPFSDPRRRRQLMTEAQPPIEHRRLGTGGPEVSAIGLGFMSFRTSAGAEDEKQATEVVAEAIDLGVHAVRYRRRVRPRVQRDPAG